MRSLRPVLALVIIFSSLAAYADSDLPIFDYKIRNSEQRSSVYWFPLASLFVPGLGQYLNDQYGAASLYAGVAGGAYLLTLAGESRQDYKTSSADPNDFDRMTAGDEMVMLGEQTYQDIGFVSMYHTFRSTVKQRQGRKQRRDFGFLKRDDGEADETPDQLMLAPFHFQFLARPTTYIPLSLVVLASIVSHNEATSYHYLTGSDASFALATSYNAGVSEESAFRGYLMMNLRQSWNSDLWSNVGSSTLFAAAHISSDNPVPVPQFLLGTYLAWLAQHNKWTLSEGVFIHAWWDVFAITAALIDNSVIRKPMMLPAFAMTF